MAFYINTVNFYPGIYAAPTAAGTGSPFVAASVSAGFWAYPGNSQYAPTGVLATRSTLTHGFVAGGYKDASPWRTINKTWHANDITLSCGEQLQQSGAYNGSTFSDYNGYMHGANGDYAGSGTHTSSYNLGTGVNRTVNTGLAGANPGGPFGYTGKDPGNDGAGVVYGVSAANAGNGSWEMSVSRTYFAGTQNQIGQVGYITGGSQSNAVDKFNFPTEIMYIAGSANGAPLVSHSTGAGGSTVMWWSFGGTNRQMAFSNDTWSSWAPGTTAAPDGICKMLPTKLGYHYVGSGANATAPFQKFSDISGSTITAALSKPSAQGEENMQMGQNWGYCLGAYNGLQNNYTFKVDYSTDIMLALGSASQPKGHVGLSSAATSSAAATVAMSNL